MLASIFLKRFINAKDNEYGKNMKTSYRVLIVAHYGDLVEGELRLRAHGIIDVDTAVNGEEGLERAVRAGKDDNPFDAIVSDVHRPGMEGPDFYRKGKELGIFRNVPIIYIAGPLSQEQQEQVQATQPLGVFTKNGADIWGQILDALDHYRDPTHYQPQKVENIPVGTN